MPAEISGRRNATTDEKRAFAALDALKQVAPPLWQTAYEALAGVYWTSTQPRVTAAFDQLLGPRTVGEQLAQKAAWTTRLTGNTWFYHGSRYGEYEMTLKTPEADDYLQAGPEWSPAASSRYLELGDTYVEAGYREQARAEYDAALELSPQRAEIVDPLARLDWETGRKTEAIEKWKQAFDLERSRVLNTKLTPSFWTTVKNILIEANRNRIVAQVRPNADGMFAAYIRFNGGYNSTPFVEGILTDAADRARAMQWIKDLTVDPKSASVLEELLTSPLLTVSDKDAVYRELIARDQKAKPGEEEDVNGSLLRHQVEYVGFLDAEKRYDEAWRVATTIKEYDSQRYGGVDLRILLHVAARSGHLDILLAELKKKSGTSTDSEPLLAAASGLQRKDRPGRPTNCWTWCTRAG
jgi:tetratricopeptide (TPR) repeat protein